MRAHYGEPTSVIRSNGRAIANHKRFVGFSLYEATKTVLEPVKPVGVATKYKRRTTLKLKLRN